MGSLFDQFNGTPPVGITPGMDNTQQPMPYVDQQQPDLVSNGAPLSWQQRLMTLLRNPSVLASQVGNGIQNAMMPNTEGLMGLLSPADQQHARTMALLHAGAALSAAGGPHVGTPAPSLMQAISSGLSAGQEASTQDINTSLQNRMEGMSVAQQMRILAGRQAIGRMFAPKEGETPSETAARLPQAYAAYAALGDTDMMSKLGDVIKQMPQFQGLNPMDIDTGDKKVIINGKTGQPLFVLPKGMSQDALANMQFSHTIAQSSLDQRTQAHNDEVAYQQIQQKQHEEDSWMRDVKPYSDDARIMGTVEAALPHTMNNPVAQRQVLQGFVQLMNPNATNIRPNALSPYINTMGLSSELSKAVSKLDNGQALSPVQMSQVAHLYQQLKTQRLGEYQTLRKARIGQARAMGLNMANLYDPFSDTGIPQQSTGRVNPLLQP